MESQLEYILTHSYKAEMINYLKSHPEAFDKTVQLALSDKQPFSWRAAWLLWSCIKVNDPRLWKYQKKIIDILSERNDDQVRELFIILQRMKIDKENEGKLFDICANTWKNTIKKSSVRFNAFKLMVKIAQNHPDLNSEIIQLTDSRYMDSLSVNVQQSIFRMTSKFDNQNKHNQ